MRAGKEKKFDEIYAKYKDSVFGISIVYLKDYQLAEDATQETFVKVLRKLNSLKDKNKTKAWITRVAINTCRDKLKSAERREYSGINISEPVASNPDTDERLSVRDAVSKLSPELREIVILYYYQGFTLQEISNMLNIHFTTVSYRLKIAKAQLKASLGREEDYDE